MIETDSHFVCVEQFFRTKGPTIPIASGQRSAEGPGLLAKETDQVGSDVGGSNFGADVSTLSSLGVGRGALLSCDDDE